MLFGLGSGSPRPKARHLDLLPRSSRDEPNPAWRKSRQPKIPAIKNISLLTTLYRLPGKALSIHGSSSQEMKLFKNVKLLLHPFEWLSDLLDSFHL